VPGEPQKRRLEIVLGYLNIDAHGSPNRPSTGGFAARPSRRGLCRRVAVDITERILAVNQPQLLKKGGVRSAIARGLSATWCPDSMMGSERQKAQ
jgi:hypothetical protein